MKTINIIKPKKVIVNEAEMPKRRHGEALLKIQYAGICGSDLSTYRGQNAYALYPRIPGHEFSATIEEIDENEYGLKKGMVVTCNPYFNCGTCYSCKKGLVNACEKNQTMGVQRDGAFAQYITMPLDRIYYSNGISPLELTLVEPLCISYHGVNRANIMPGDNVLVMGAGTIGTLAGIVAKAKGANVFISDISAKKAKFAAENFGLDGFFVNTSNIEQYVLEQTGGDGFDVTIEAVGLPETFQDCIDAACFGGRVILIGVSKRNIEDFFFTQIQKKELTILGSRNAIETDFYDVFNLIRSNKIKLDSVISRIYKLDEADKAFSDFDKECAKILKILIDFTN